MKPRHHIWFAGSGELHLVKKSFPVMAKALKGQKAITVIAKRAFLIFCFTRPKTSPNKVSLSWRTFLLTLG